MALRAWASAVCLLLTSCIHAQLTENTIETVSTVEELRARQFLDNISDAIDRKDRTPSQVIVNTGQALTSAGATLAAIIPAMNLSKNTRTLNPSVTGTWTDFWSLSPIADPQDLQNLIILYALLYRDDAKILDVVKDTIDLYKIAKSPQEIKDNCGVTFERGKTVIWDSKLALASYLNALSAFPTKSDTVTVERRTVS